MKYHPSRAITTNRTGMVRVQKSRSAKLRFKMNRFGPCRKEGVLIMAAMVRILPKKPKMIIAMPIVKAVISSAVE